MALVLGTAALNNTKQKILRRPLAELSQKKFRIQSEYPD
jgi:hypothetical protein